MPDTQVIARTLEHVRSASDPFLFNHAVRSWLFAVRLAQLQNLQFDAEVVAVGALLHDIGRFVLEAADMAADFARSQGMSGMRARAVWHCVAMNSSRCLALSRESDAVVCSDGIDLDIQGGADDRIPGHEAERILEAYPRLGHGPNLRDFCGGWPIKGGVREARAYWPDVG